jgi:hypothetical protein
MRPDYSTARSRGFFGPASRVWIYRTHEDRRRIRGQADDADPVFSASSLLCPCTIPSGRPFQVRRCMSAPGVSKLRLKTHRHRTRSGSRRTRRCQVRMHRCDARPPPSWAMLERSDHEGRKSAIWPPEPGNTVVQSGTNSPANKFACKALHLIQSARNAATTLLERLQVQFSLLPVPVSNRCTLSVLPFTWIVSPTVMSRSRGNSTVSIFEWPTST